MTKKQKPSRAQAKFIARTWSRFTNTEINVGRYLDPTTAACIKYGWLKNTGRTELHPNKTEFEIYILSDLALDALETYLREDRYKRQAAQNPSGSVTESGADPTKEIS